MGGLLGGALILSLAGNGYLYSKKADCDFAIRERNQIKSSCDSLQIVMQNLSDSLIILANYKDENGRLTDQLESMEGQNNPRVMELLAEVNRLRGQLNRKTVPAVNTVVSGGTRPLNAAERKLIEEYKSQILDFQRKINALQADKDSFNIEKEAYCKQLNAQTVEEKYACNQENNKLKERILKASAPQFGVLQTTGIESNGKQKLETFKAKKVERLKIAFDVLENPLLAAPVNEEVTIRIIDPEGNVVSMSGDDETLKQNILVDSDMSGNMKVIMYYPSDKDLSGKLKKGKYYTELYSRNKIKQKNYFELD